MPSASGVYSLPTGYLAVTGTTIEASQHNPPLEDIAAALTLRLSRDGTAPMTGPLQLVAGTVGLPGAVFSTDPSSGFYKTASGIGVAIGGTKVAEFLAGGVVGARFVGELIPYTGTAAPALTVLPHGQTLSRTTYAALWVVAQAEIAAGNTFYNNGDGSTTFGIGDARGRFPVGWDKMGGTASGRVTTAGSGVDGTTIGATGGAQSQPIQQGNLPAIALAFSGTQQTWTVTTDGTLLKNSGFEGAVSASAEFVGFNSAPPTVTITPAGTVTAGGSSTLGSGNQLVTMPPAFVCNFLLFAGA